MESPAVKEPQPPEDTVSDTSTSQINDRSETPDSNRGLQDNDSVSSSPKICKPVLGKAQAKKRLMAFAKFTVSVKPALEKSKEKIQINPFTKDSDSHKLKSDDLKSSKDPKTGGEKPDESQEFHPDSEDDPQKSQSFIKKIKKRSEKKLSAIDEIIQEESRQKQIIAGEITEKPMIYDKFNSRHQTEPRNRDSSRRYRDNRFRNNYDDNRRFNPRFNDTKSPQSRQNDHKRRRNSSERRDNDRGRDNRSRRDRRRSISHEEEQNPRPSEPEKLDDDLESKVDRKSNKNKSDRNSSRISLSEASDSNWRIFKSQGNRIKGKLPHNDSPSAAGVELRCKNPQDYKNHFDQMLMMSDTKSSRSSVLINGIDDEMKEFPPESIRITRRFKGNMFYSENPNVSLYMDRKRLAQVLPPDRCRIMREITDAPFRDIESYEPVTMRNWFKRIDSNGKLEIVRKIPNLMEINASVSGELVGPHVPPKSRWEVDESLELIKPEEHIPEEYVEEVFVEELTEVEVVKSPEEKIDDEVDEEIEEDEEVADGLVSEYEEFMKMVSTEPNVSEDKDEDDEILDVKSSPALKKIIKIQETIQELISEDYEEETLVSPKELVEETPEIMEKIIEDPEIPQESIKSKETPEVNTSKANRNDESKSLKTSKSTKKNSKKKRITATETSDSSSSDSEYERRKRKRKRRKKKKQRDSSTSSSGSSSSSDDDSSSEEVSKKRKKTSKKRRKQKKAKLRKKKSRRDSSDSESSSSPEREERSRKRKKKNKIVVKHSKVSKRDRSRSSEKHKLRKIKTEIEDEDIPLEKDPIPVAVEIAREPGTSKMDIIIIKVEKNPTPSVSEQLDEEMKPDTIDESSQKSPEFQLEKEKLPIVEEKVSVEITDPEKIAAIPIPPEIHPFEILKPEEIPLPLTPVNSKVISLPCDDKPEEELLEKKRKIELELLKTQKPKNLEKKRRSASTSSTSSSSSTSSWSSSSSSSSSKYSGGQKKKHGNKKSHKKSPKIGKKTKNKWATEFDFDFPSLTQLEEGRVGTLIDDWEVDSMEAVTDFVTSYTKDTSKKTKKIEKEVRYDEKTDTYIAVEKELIRDNKKKTSGRICALRIWEDEEEEGEREALLMKGTTEPEEKSSEAAASASAPVVADLKTKKEEIKSPDERSVDPEEKKDQDKVSEPKEKFIEVRKTRWEIKKSDLSISQDPPTPEGPLVPVNWEEEEEWTSSLKSSIDSCIIKPVQAPIASPGAKLKPESEKIKKLDIKQSEIKIDVEKTPESPVKDQLYSPSSPADSHKSGVEGTSSSDSSSESSTSSATSSESGQSPKVAEEGTKIKNPLPQSMKQVDSIESLTPPLISPPKSDEFLIKKAPEESASDNVNSLHQLKMDIFSKLREHDFEKIQTQDPVDSKSNETSSKRSSGSKTPSDTPPKVSPPASEDSTKAKEVFRNTFIEITSQTSLSPGRKISPRDAEKSKSRISEERTSNSSYPSRSSKDQEKSKFDDRSRRERSPSLRPERRRFNSPGDRKQLEKRRSPNWKRRHSRSRSRSWSRSRSPSPDRRDRQDRQKRFKHPEERRERFSSPGRRPRERRSRERDWSIDKSDKSYDPLEMLRVNKRFRDPESRKSGDNATREGSDSQDIYDIRPLLDLKFDERIYPRDSLDREIMEGPIIPPLCPELELKIKYRRETGGERRRDIDWDRRESSERFPRRRSPERRPRSRLSPRARRSPRKSERRFLSRSRSRSWTRSRSRSKTPTRARSHERSSSRSRQSIDRSRRKSRSRSFSPRRRRREDSRFRRSTSRDKGRKIETIVHPPGMNPPAPEDMSNSMINEEAQPSSSFRYQSDTTEDFTYFASNNLTYPPRVEESSGSPKRLSLDDRLELELGIKKSQETLASIAYPHGYPHMPGVLSNSSIPLPPRGVPGPSGLGFHRPPTVLQVGNVLQVVPRDYQPSGVPPVQPPHPDIPPTPVPSAANVNRVLRVGNVLQVVPTTNLDWSGSGSALGMDRPPPYPLQSVVLNVPLPSVVASLPHPLPVPIPQASNAPPAPVVLLPKLVAPKPPPVPQPVYDYEAIMEARKKEKEERRRLREEKRNEKENRRIIRMRKRADKILDRVSGVNETAEVEVAEETIDTPDDSNKLIDDDDDDDDNEETAGESATLSAPGESAGEPSDVKEFGAEYDEDEEVDLEGDVDEDDEEEDEVEESEEEQDDEDSRIIPGLGDLKECEEARIQVVEETAEGMDAITILPIPKKGILVPPGLWANRLLNGDGDDDEDDNEISVKLEDSVEAVQICEIGDVGELGDDEEKEERDDREKRLRTRWARARKAVQFADGVKPGEGTSPSGGEGDMPSPPPPASSSLSDPVREMGKKRMRKRDRKKPKRVKVQKTKKKVKVKIIKLKKPRITPLTALMLDDSDEMDDRSPPPPPPGSPPPPHQWPSYLAAYSATLKSVEAIVSPPSVTQTAPPPTPLPLLVPPPPLNYTIQPLNKA